MTSLMTQELHNLLSKIGTYRQMDVVSGQILECFRTYSNLKPILGVIPAQSSHCVVLRGTVPMYYRNNKYNIPVGMWIPTTFPSSPPIPYVLPTGDMFIRPNHPQVDKYGKVTLDYIHPRNWRPGQSTLLESVNQLCIEFGKNPPVSSGPSPSSGSAQHHRPPPPQQQQPVFQRPGQYPAGQYQHKPQPQQERMMLLSQLSQKMFNDLSVKRSDLVRHGNTVSKEIDSRCGEVQQKQSMAGNMARDHSQLETSIGRMKLAIADIDRQIASLEASAGPVDPHQRNALDEATDPDNASRRQVSRLTAENQALEDAMYKIYVAMCDDEVEPIDGLKYIRKLAKEQFYDRALLWKIEKTRMMMARRGQPQQPPRQAVQ
ncbi:UEV domain [Carpediemonas membranifera]|uniref:UEV domain n=1 Tax=Carpediemonas membranifera TaxID=201153 RepID=A0A8J6E5U5_9EUKA|nr:UEV domain [Carpediemonas membranifera]QNO39391.1 vacuolar protein sorting 23B [Carpediemonas membranifera]|eukprot:KAG9396322.1 UEV domain [Carpediemonas membranifera]